MARLNFSLLTIWSAITPLAARCLPGARDHGEFVRLTSMGLIRLAHSGMVKGHGPSPVPACAVYPVVTSRDAVPPSAKKVTPNKVFTQPAATPPSLVT